MRLYGPRWTATAASPAGVSVAYTSPAVSKCACDLDTEVAQYRRVRLSRVVVEKNVVAVGPQAWLAANEGPDLAQGAGPHAAPTAPGRHFER
jgi:hypothetical protein